MINSKRVYEIFTYCLFKGEEVVDDKPIIDPVIVQGITSRFGLHPTRLEECRNEVKEMLQEIKKSFLEGDSFLNFCYLENEEQLDWLPR